jgi:site-specific DNA-methyltransferase (adenine-specific)
MIINGDALEALKELGNNSVELIVADPPYCLDKLDNFWDISKIASIKNMGVVTSLPSGMKFDKDQGKKFYEWYLPICKELHRVLVPGGFFFTFSAPRIFHRVGVAVEDAGFLIKDQFIWIYTQNQPKAMALNHFIGKLKTSISCKEALMEALKGWKTPQVKSCFEPIVVGQKEIEDNYIENTINYGTGLVNTQIKQSEDKFPSNIMSTEGVDEILDRYFLVPKPTKSEKGEFNTHKTVKPVDICQYLIALTTRDGATVLDPFCGSGTTLVAAKNIGRKFIGIDINEEYIEICKRRLNENQNT